MQDKGENLSVYYNFIYVNYLPNRGTHQHIAELEPCKCYFCEVHDE